MLLDVLEQIFGAGGHWFKSGLPDHIFELKNGQLPIIGGWPFSLVGLICDPDTTGCQGYCRPLGKRHFNLV